MTRVKCRRRDCVFLDDGVCGRDLITIDEDEGCLNFEEVTDSIEDDDDLDWDSEDEEEEDVDFYEEDDEWEDEEEEEAPSELARDDWGV